MVRAALHSGIAIVFALAAASKLLDPQVFRESLETWTLIPRPFLNPMAIAVPVFEACVSLWIVSNVIVRGALYAAGTFLTIISGGWVVQSLVASPPECACFGEVENVLRLRNEVWWVVVRNGTLILFIGASLFASKPGVKQ